jgi:hypothetical protein
MMRTNFILLLIAVFVVSSSLTRTESLQNYTLSYTYKNPDGTLFRVIKYYMLDGIKFRIEYYSLASSVNYNVSVDSELQLDGETVKKESQVNVDVNGETTLQAPDLTNIEAHTIEILQKDKELVWTMTPQFNQYSEVALRQDSWERSVNGLLVTSYPDPKKTGEINLLDYECNVYESVQITPKSNWKNIIIAVQGLDVVLKTELWQNDKLVQTMEAMEFSREKPAASLFEIPEGYQKNDSNQ